MIALSFRLPNTANYCLWFSDVKTLDLKELLPHFPELLPQMREKRGKRGILRAYFRGTHGMSEKGVHSKKGSFITRDPGRKKMNPS
ncbi:MAG: hypothetical protein WC593_01930 [Methanoregula sp.]